MTEKEIQNEILRTFGCRSDMIVFRMNVGAARQGKQFVRFLRPGFADLMFLLSGGRTLFVEVKSKTGRQSKDQKTFQRIVEQLGFDYIIARSVEDVDDALRTRFAIGWTPGEYDIEIERR